MMIPKTLAALPNSQYATTFEVLGGKLEALAALSWVGGAASEAANVDESLLRVKAPLNDRACNALVRVEFHADE